MSKFLKLCSLLLLVNTVYASEHEDIVKAMKKPKAKNEVMSKHKSAVTILLQDLLKKEDLKELDKQKLEESTVTVPSPTPHSSLFDHVSNVYAKKAHAFTPAKPTPLPTFVSLKQNDTPVITQWNGTCTAHASIAAMENILKASSNLSERHHWSTYEQYSSHESVKAAQSKPIEQEYVWPHTSLTPKLELGKGERFKLSKVEYIGYNPSRLQEHLSKGLPAIVAMTVPKDLGACLPVVREASEVDTNAGHAMAVVGYGLDSSLQSKGYFTVKNSWGENCHAKGYASIPYNQCLKPNAYCAFWLFTSVEKL